MMAGAYDGSHHSATTAKLARWGLLERRERGGGLRRVAWEYRCAAPGAELAERVSRKRRRATASSHRYRLAIALLSAMDAGNGEVKSD